MAVRALRVLFLRSDEGMLGGAGDRKRTGDEGQGAQKDRTLVLGVVCGVLLMWVVNRFQVWDMDERALFCVLIALR